MTARATTRCAICGIPRADHGYTAVADHEGNLGIWHDYLSQKDATAIISAIENVASAYAALTPAGRAVVDSLTQAPTPRKD